MKGKIILVILLAALTIRLVNINQSFWLDEGISVQTANTLSFKSIVLDFAPGDFHPPLYYLVLKMFLMPLGSSELVARSPSIIFGVLTVFVVYGLAKTLYDRKTAQIAAVLLATSPLHVYYSQEARMYSMAAFLASLSLYFFVKIIEKDKIIYWAGFIFSTIALLYTDYMPYLITICYFLYLFIYRKKLNTTLKSYVPSVLIIIVLLLPWIGTILHQLSSGLSLSSTNPTWHSAIGSSSIKDLVILFPKFIIGRISPDNNFTYLIFFAPVALFVCLLVSMSTLRMNTKRSILWFYLLVPILVSYAISFYLPVFSYFRLLFVLPVVYILVASAINNLNWTKPTTILLTIFLAINLTSLTIYFSNPKFQREDWKQATEFVKSLAREDTKVFFEANFVVPSFDIYNKNSVSAKGVLDSFNPDPQKVLENVILESQGTKHVFLFNYLAPISDPSGLVFKSLVDSGFVNTSTKDFRGVGFVYEFTK